MITKLVLKNWRSHEDSNFEFSKGTNVLVGSMGSGKSAAMDAISFALFGTFPNVQNRKIKLDDIIMNKPEQKRKASVELSFKIDNIEYKIKRVIERGKGVTSSELRRGETLVEGPQTKRTTEKISELLKMNYDLFSRAVYAEQNNIDYFLEIPKGQRKDKIDDLLNINKFEMARKNIGTVINRLKDRIDEKERFVSEIKEIDNIPKLKSEIEEKKDTLGKRKNVVEELQKEKVAINTDYEAVTQKKKEYDDLNEKTDGLKAVTEKDTKSLESYKKRLDSIKVSPDVENRKKEVKSSLEKTRDEIEEKRASKKALESHISHIEDGLEKLHEGKERCPVCDSDLNEEKKMDVEKKRLSEKQQTLKDIEKLSIELKDLDGKKQSNEKELDVLDIEIRKLEEIKWITEERKKLETELGNNKETLSNLNDRLNKLDYDDSKEKFIYGKLKDIEKNLAVAEREQQGLVEIIKEKEERLTELSKIEKELLETRDEIIYLQKTVSSFETLQNVLQNVQTTLRQEFTDTTNAALSEVWSKVYPYRDYINLRLNVDDSGDYILQLKTRKDDWINVEGITSGGERSTACLALRIALSFVLARNLSWLVLDEPTHNLDRNAIIELSKILRDELPQIVEQIFIITHEPELEKAASGFLYRLERNKEEDEPTRVNAETAMGFA
jgi:exonuclease SbcC